MYTKKNGSKSKQTNKISRKYSDLYWTTITLDVNELCIARLHRQFLDEELLYKQTRWHGEAGAFELLRAQGLESKGCGFDS